MKRERSESEFLQRIQTLKKRPLRSGLRALRDEEIAVLQTQGNRCDDWSRIRVTRGFSPRSVHGSRFFGDCVLGELNGEVAVSPGLKMPAGILDSSICDSDIGPGALVAHSTVCRYHVGSEAVVYRVGLLEASERNRFANGMTVVIGPETGGRELPVFAEITLNQVEQICLNRTRRGVPDSYRDFVEEYARQAELGFGVVEDGAVIKNTPSVVNSFVGQGVVIDHAGSVSGSCLLGAEDEITRVESGSIVKESLVQWGVSVSDMAYVERSVLSEHSHVEQHGKVMESFIGPNSGVAKGEITSSLVGPFVGFHHQSLLISALWPRGKGNIGYGANVGSNHTSKAPDQELWVGEGVFFGLGVNIKFPANFTESPYSIIATRVTTAPQRLAFPFSLINTPSRTLEGVSPDLNEIFPGWVLWGNIYALRRNEGKYRKRNRARRTPIPMDVFRPEIVDMMRDALTRLESADPAKRVLLEKDVPGLGKNFVLKGHLKRGVQAYRFYLDYYGFAGLLHRIEALLNQNRPGDVPGILSVSSDDPLWEHQRTVLMERGHDGTPVADLLGRFSEMQDHVIRATASAKEKDDGRGRRIIPDYDFTHVSGADDAFVLDTRKEMAALKERIKAIMARLPSGAESRR